MFIKNFGRSMPMAMALFMPLASASPILAEEMAKPTTEMQAVLDKLATLEAKPFFDADRA